MEVFADKLSGKTADRPEPAACLDLPRSKFDPPADLRATGCQAAREYSLIRPLRTGLR